MIRFRSRATQLVARVLASGLVALGSMSCVHSMDSSVDLNSDPREDRTYYPVLKRSTQSADVIKNFETRFKVRATWLSPEFRTAFAKRLGEVYQQTDASFGEADAKAGFFVTIYAPDHNAVDLANPHHWNLFMRGADGTIKPSVVKRINDKIRWSPFFDTINPWTTEYLVVFDTAPVNANSPELVGATPVELTLANADAQVTLKW